MSEHPVLAVHALEDLPVIGTLVFVFAMGRITEKVDHKELLHALGVKQDHWEHAKIAYAFAVFASVVATVITILQKTYGRLRGSGIKAPFARLAWIAKSLLWLSLIACLMGVAFESESVYVSSSIAITIVVVLSMVHFYRRTFHALLQKAD